MIDEANMAEQYLTDHVAEEGMQFGWHDGEFMYWEDMWWDEP